MKCPFCNCKDLKVMDSRNVEANNIKRRRMCVKCNTRFTTFETIDLVIQVKKRDNTFEDFQKEKLLKGLNAACKNSSISHDQVRVISDKIISQLMKNQTREIESKELGNIVMKRLKDLDVVAYLRFACVYNKLKNIEEVINTIKSIT